jgi:type II secretory pathway component PulF
MLKSGITIERGLDIMKKGKKDVLLRVLDQLQFHVSRGGALWDGMSGLRNHFDPLQVMTVKAAEDSGTLVEACKSLSRYYRHRHQENRRLRAALIYPVILLHGVVMLPPLKYLFLDNLERSYWSIVLPVLLTAYILIGGTYFYWKTFCRSGRVREFADAFFLKLPIFGKLAVSLALARVFRALSGLHNAGVPPVMAARQAIQTAGNTAVAWRLEGAMPILENGGTFTNFFSFAGLLPSMQLGVVAVAEETGTLSESLDRLVKQMEEANSERLTRSVKAFAYIAYLIAAVIVAYTVISFYSNYFSIA